MKVFLDDFTCSGCNKETESESIELHYFCNSSADMTLQHRRRMGVNTASTSGPDKNRTSIQYEVKE